VYGRPFTLPDKDFGNTVGLKSLLHGKEILRRPIQTWIFILFVLPDLSKKTEGHPLVDYNRTPSFDEKDPSSKHNDVNAVTRQTSSN
jgi:hypothetical protein